jgi:hypothetical protein
MHDSAALALWTYEAIRDECREAYNKYSRELDAHYQAYFAANPTFRGHAPTPGAGHRGRAPA